MGGFLLKFRFGQTGPHGRAGVDWAHWRPYLPPERSWRPVTEASKVALEEMLCHLLSTSNGIHRPQSGCSRPRGTCSLFVVLQ